MTTQLRDDLQRALGEAYAIERELGGGGMSRVLLAHERALGRRVVVKLLRPELAARMSVERFRREIGTIAALQHPNIVPVLGAGEVDGLPYFVMPYIEGESLRHRLAAGPLLPLEAVRILRDVTRALAAAHARGIVHRDIKPDNVLLAGGAAIVADFGVAKALASSREGASASATPGTGALTTVGTSLGTPQYMAPEQVAADPAIGPAADLYALGVMAYEMLAGEPPFAGRSPQALMLAHLTEAPPPLAARRPELPAALTELVMCCLAKDAAHRPASAEALGAALEDPAVVSGAYPPISGGMAASLGLPVPGAPTTGGGSAPGAPAASTGPTTAPSAGRPARTARRVAAVAAATLAAGLATWGLAGRGARGAAVAPAGVAVAGLASVPAQAPTPARSAPAPNTLAVLPVVYVGADSGNAYMAAGVADALTGALSRVKALRVASRTSTSALQRRLAAGDTSALPVALLVEGVLEQEGRRLRLSMRVVDARDGFTVWADQYDGDVGNILAMEDAMARRIADVLASRAAESGAATSPAPSATGTG